MFLCNEKIYILKVSQINVLISKVSDMPLTEDGISFFKWVYPYVGRTVLISTSPVFFFLHWPYYWLLLRFNRSNRPSGETTEPCCFENTTSEKLWLSFNEFLTTVNKSYVHVIESIEFNAVSERKILVFSALSTTLI